MYDMKDHLRTFLPEAGVADLPTRKLMRRFAEIRLQFGESKKTRSEAIGHLILAEHKDVVKFVKGREYQ